MASRKKVLVCACRVPFVSGGAELLNQGLVQALRRSGYAVDTIEIPYRWHPPERIMESALVWRLQDLDDLPAGSADLVIATRFPSYGVIHPNKVAWVVHQHRGAYDLAGTIYDDMGLSTDGEMYRKAVRSMDRRFLLECRKVFTISSTVSRRLREYCGIDSTPLLHPPPLEGRYFPGEYTDDVLVVGRLDPLKRVDLAIRAMQFVRNPRARLRIAGTGFLEPSLVELTGSLGLEGRVIFEGYLSQERLLDAYSRAGCVLYVPYQEDLGYVTIEAFCSRRPVITTLDSGGPLEFVRDGENGLVAPARPEELAGCIDRLLENRKTARAFGLAGYRAVEGLSWENVMREMVEPFLE